MSTHKTQFDQHAAEAFVQDHLHTDHVELFAIADGESAQAYFFETPEGSRVLRVTSHGEDSFRKDQLAFQKLHHPAVPIPETLEVGTMDNGLSYAISVRAPGKMLDQFTPEEITALMPEIIATVEAIHTIEPLGEGYGKWDLTGTGRSVSWREELIASTRQDDEETRVADFYDVPYHDQLRAEILPMIDGCPEERKLIHDDFGFNNTLSDGTKITGVIDWELAAYGDPLKDVAWLDFWEDKHGYAAAFEQYYKEKGTLPDDYRHRITCYKLLIGLGSLGFFARSRQEKSYHYAKDIIGRIER